MNDIIRQLQQRIDKKSNWLTANEAKYDKTYHIAWKEIVREHTLDKRLMGELINLARDYAVYRKHALRIISGNKRKV